MPRLLFATVLTLASIPALADRQVTHPFASATPAAHVRHLVIDIGAGGIRVINSRSAEIRVSGLSRRDFDGWSRHDENQRIVDDVSVEAYVNEGEAVVRRHFGANAQSWRSRKFTTVELTVEVPRGVSVSFETAAGEIHMDGSFGDVDIDLRAGEVHFTTPRADVRELSASVRVGEVHAELGHQTVVREGLFPGRTHFENPAGHSTVNVHVTAGEVHVRLTP
jgi:hypothetical protein